jgi:hypothetical protein
MLGRSRKIGFCASMMSIGGSLFLYFTQSNETLGIFVGLWAPTIMLAAKEIEEIFK